MQFSLGGLPYDWIKAIYLSSCKSFFSASLSVPLRIIKSSKGLHAKWKAVTLPQDSQAIYRLFVEWRNKGKPHVRLLYEGNQTSSNLQDKLPIPSRMYVSIVVKQANSTTNFEHQAGSIITYPTKQALIPATLPLKPNNPGIVDVILKVSTVIL